MTTNVGVMSLAVFQGQKMNIKIGSNDKYLDYQYG